METLAAVIRTQARENPDVRAIVAPTPDGERVWTYAQLDAESNRVGQALRAEGVGPGDRVAFLDKNVPEYFTLLYGGAKLGAVSVGINWRLAPPEMAYILANSEAKVFVVGHEFSDQLARMAVPDGVRVVRIGVDDGEHVEYEAWIADHPAEDPGHESDPDDTCYQLYTSGTTGLPKGVETTNANLVACMSIGSEVWGFRPDAVNLIAMPLFHISGSGWAVGGMFGGCEGILLREVDPVQVLDAIERYGVTTAILVPAVLQFLQAIPQAAETDFSSLETVVYGASPITEAVLVGAMELMGSRFVQAYGLTETTGGIVALYPEDHDPGGPKAHLLRSAGKAWGDVELRVVDPATGEDRPDGEVGEVWCRSAQNMLGYWRNPEATAAAFDGDWFKTGDAGYLVDGYLYIHDRVKDMIISGGENIYPAEVENALMTHPSIADVAVIGIPSEKWGETPIALVTRADDGLTEDDVVAYARENLAHYKCPTQVVWHDAIPRNPSGKILKTELRKPYWAGRERAVN